MTQSNSSCILAALVLVMLMSAGIAEAGTVQPVDHFYVSVGAYKASNDIKLRWDPPHGTGLGTHVSVKHDFGMDLDQTERFSEIGGTIGRRNQLKVFHYGFDTSASKILDRTMVIGNDVYHETAAFTGDIDVSRLGVTYSYLIHRSRKSAFGIGLGAIRYKVSSNMAATLAGDVDVDTASGAFSESAWAPQLHVEYIRSFAQHWRFGIDASYVRKSGGRISGSAKDLRVKLEYFPWKHFGFALRYNYNDINLEFDHGHYRGKIDVDSHGPQLVATLRF